MTALAARPAGEGGPRTDVRTLLVLALALAVALWMASEIEMNLFMAFVAWALIAVRTIFHENAWVTRATVIALLIWAIVLPFFHDSGGGFIEDATLALAYAVMALGLNIIVGLRRPARPRLRGLLRARRAHGRLVHVGLLRRARAAARASRCSWASRPRRCRASTSTSCSC